MRRRGGFVLVCVLWVLAILTVLTIGFAYRAVLDRRAAAYSLDRSQARLMAHAAVQRGIIELRNKIVKDNLRQRDVARTHLGQTWARAHSLLEDKDNLLDLGEGFENDKVVYSIEDQERYIDINGAKREVLEEVEPLGKPALRRIWKRRTEGVHEDEGKNPVNALEELRYIRGVDEEDWFGEGDEPGLKDLVSVVGGNRVNVNTASYEVLQCIPDLDDNAIDVIMEWRVGGDGEIGTGDDQGFKNIEHLAEVTGIDGDSLVALQEYCKTDSNYFKITGIATRRGGKVRVVSSAIVYVRENIAGMKTWQEVSLGS